MTIFHTFSVAYVWEMPGPMTIHGQFMSILSCCRSAALLILVHILSSARDEIVRDMNWIYNILTDYRCKFRHTIILFFIKPLLRGIFSKNTRRWFGKFWIFLAMIRSNLLWRQPIQNRKMAQLIWEKLTGQQLTIDIYMMMWAELVGYDWFDFNGIQWNRVKRAEENGTFYWMKIWTFEN